MDFGNFVFQVPEELAQDIGDHQYEDGNPSTKFFCVLIALREVRVFFSMYAD